MGRVLLRLLGWWKRDVLRELPPGCSLPVRRSARGSQRRMVVQGLHGQEGSVAVAQVVVVGVPWCWWCHCHVHEHEDCEFEW